VITLTDLESSPSTLPTERRWKDPPDLLRIGLAIFVSFGLAAVLVVVQSVVKTLSPPPDLDLVRNQAPIERWAPSIVVWLVAPVVAGAAIREHRLAVYLGVLVAAVAFRILDGSRARLPFTEMDGLGEVVGNIALIVYAVMAAPLVLLGAQLGERATRRTPARPQTRRLITSVAAGGMTLYALTFALSSAVPDAGSFTIDLSPEWHALPYAASDPTYGQDFTAMPRPIPSILRSTDVPSYYQPPTIPVVGVSVHSVWWPGTPADCFGAFDPWPGNPMLYQTERIRAGETTLPVGPAYEWVGKRENLTFYAYSFGRERRLLFHTRQLCYMAVVTVPDTSSMTEADARAIAESVRYR
jgi:hypothetical protein